MQYIQEAEVRMKHHSRTTIGKEPTSREPAMTLVIED